ncbi:MarR family winged helix-turn-helix transcriptional regulator [Streptomyces zhihengii]|uniref:MarR family winged helix-turn-helix transcriptional regulator n=1 Tax=Streptomyces zhihengii TaxID=1818004 RepID=UPI0036C7CAFC
MPAPDTTPGTASDVTSRSAGCITELLDVLWEHARNSTSHATTPLSTSQLRLLYAVDRDDGIRMRRACTVLASSPSNVSRLCDRLQAMGFLERHPCPGSKREITLKLTAAGKTHLQEIREKRDAMLHRAIENLDPAERNALGEGLTALAAQLRFPAGRDPDNPRTRQAA